MVEKLSHSEQSMGSEDKEEIVNIEIAEIKEPAQVILESIRPEIDRGEYTHIIGDDASGRIPALIIGKVIASIYADKGYPLPTRSFLAGSGKENCLSETDVQRKAASMSEFFSDCDPEETKILIVTDTISTGGTLEPLTSLLQSRGLDCEIATLAFAGYPKAIKRKLNNRIIIGSNHTPSIYRKPMLSGVLKNPEDVHSSFVVGLNKELSVARNDARIVSEELIDWYRSGETIKETP